MWTEVNRLRQGILPPQPPPQYNFLPQRSSARSLPQQSCSASKTEPEGDGQDKQGEVPLEVQVGEQDDTKGNMEPERTAFESP